MNTAAQYEKEAESAKIQRFILRATVSQGVEIIEPEEVETELLSFADFLLYIDTLSHDDSIETSATPEELRAIVAQYVVRDSTTTRNKSNAAERKATLSRAIDYTAQAIAALENYHRLGGNFYAVTVSENKMQDLQELTQWQD